MASVYIPVQNSEEEVRVSLDQLPRDASDILDILKAEQAPLDLWLIIAREYFKQGKVDQFRQILEEGSSPEIDEYYADVRYERIAILNALGAYYSYLGKIETKQREKEEHFILATQYYNKASRIDMHEPSTWIGKGQLLLAKGEVEQASAAFKIVLDGDRDNVPALLGQACVEFNRGRYSDSLELYKRALQVYPDCPAPVRLGIGLCRYKLGQFEKAQQAFERVLQLDPENVEALVALAIMDLRTNGAAGIRTGMVKMQRAFEIYPYCAMALNYLANHFFFTGQHFLVEQLTETALAVTNHGPTKSHSYYNLARSYHSKGDYDKAGVFYMASVKEVNKPHEFVFPYYGLGQVQLKLGDFRSALSNFEKVLELYPDNCETLKALGHIYVHLGQTDKGQDFIRKATKIDPRDAQAFLELGELLILSDTGAALDTFKTARTLFKKGGQAVPIELLNNIGVLQFERGEFELAQQTFKEALGDGIWLSFINKENKPSVDAATSTLQFKDMQLFHDLESSGHHVEVPWDKVTVLFNLARLLEQLNESGTASILYRLILFKYPDYVDAYLRLAAIAKARNNILLSIELVNDSLKVNDKCPNALSMLGELELKNDDWVKAKETLRAASDATEGKDSYATLSLGNWNYFAAVRNEKRNPKLEATHLEKAKELYTRVLIQHSANLYAANGAGVVLAEKGHFDVSKDIFTQVQEAASGSVFVQMPDVWINLAHVYFAQGSFSLAVKMYQNCLRKFYHNTDSQILLYLARTHYEAEQWQDCIKTLLRAIHLAPSNYTLRFDAGVAMQKFSASTLQKAKRTADEVRTTVAELQNAVRIFSQLSAASNLHIHGFDEKKIDTHVGYCNHLLSAAKVHLEAAEHEEQQVRHTQELARQVELAEAKRRKAEEDSKFQLERRKQEEELRRVQQQEEHFKRVREQWKSSSHSKRRERSDDEEGGTNEKRRRKSGKKRKKDKHSKSHYDTEETEGYMVDEQEIADGDADINDREPQMNDDAEENAQDLLAAAGLEDSDAEDEMAAPSSSIARRRQALSESDDDEPLMRQSSPPIRENSTDMHQLESDGEIRDKTNGDNASEEE
ncbi:putative RNA polymerase-associated protein Ctr9 [Lupinus albus]|uniref:Putative RNA polymerase-associated protein Ctr9 n=1 Tax=Lupinus albus TaxID=3870 RepID=A0A6A4PTS6_LUPAL|nr:putative RNA polymerase-associated protein Ctr9 [Lupinus albus]